MRGRRIVEDMYYGIRRAASNASNVQVLSHSEIGCDSLGCGVTFTCDVSH
jgi:hypothetical protein